MEFPRSDEAEPPQTPPSSDASTICDGDLEKRDLESGTIKPIDRSFSHYLGLASPISANLEDIEEDLAESEDEEGPHVNASDYQRSEWMIRMQPRCDRH
jgi:hypothetical protein